MFWFESINYVFMNDTLHVRLLRLKINKVRDGKINQYMLLSHSYLTVYIYKFLAKIYLWL